MANKEALIAETILMLEKKIVDPEVCKSPSVLDGIISDEFIEFGSSGRVFDKQGVIKALAGQAPVKIQITNFRIKFLAPGVVHATYIASKETNGLLSNSLRSSVWTQKDNCWQILFHQGTVC